MAKLLVCHVESLRTRFGNPQRVSHPEGWYKAKNKFAAHYSPCRVAAARPLAARAQQIERMRWSRFLVLNAEDDPEGQLRARTFREGFEKAGWLAGRNVEVDYLWAFELVIN